MKFWGIYLCLNQNYQNTFHLVSTYYLTLSTYPVCSVVAFTCHGSELSIQNISGFINALKLQWHELESTKNALEYQKRDQYYCNSTRLSSI